MARFYINLRNFDLIAELAAESRKAAYQTLLERVIITDKDVPLVYDHSSVTEQRIQERVSELELENPGSRRVGPFQLGGLFHSGRWAKKQPQPGRLRP